MMTQVGEGWVRAIRGQGCGGLVVRVGIGVVGMGGIRMVGCCLNETDETAAWVRDAESAFERMKKDAKGVRVRARGWLTLLN